MKKNILLTGVTGYLGSRLAKEFLKKGYSVIGLVRKGADFAKIINIIDSLTILYIDDADEFSVLQEYCVDVVIHTATSYGRSKESICEIVNCNVLFPLKLLEAVSLSKNISFINVGTTLPYNINSYALSKNHFMEWGKLISKDREFLFINLTLEYFYGLSSNDSCLPSYIIKQCISNVEKIDLTLGEQYRDFIYIDDVISAFVIVLDNVDSFNEYFIEFHVGSGKKITIRNLAELIHGLTQSSSDLNFGALPYRDNEIMDPCFEGDSLEKIGWSCNTSLLDGLNLIIKEEAR